MTNILWMIIINDDYYMFQPVYSNYPDDGFSHSRQDSAKRQSAASRAGSLCRNLTRKSSIGLEDSSSVVGTSYNTLSGLHVEPTGSPSKFASLPRSTVTSSSPHGSPHRSLAGTR